MRRETPSQLVAAEIRVAMARAGVSQRQLAARMHVTQSWLSTRISPSAKVDMTVEEIAHMAEALDVPVERLLVAWLPRLDSNQQPSGYVSSQVSAVVDLSAWRDRLAS